MGLSFCARGHADFGPGAPVDGLRGEAVAEAMMGEGVEKCVGGGVVGLARGAGDGSERGEEGKKVESVAGGELLKIPCAESFGGKDRMEIFGGLIRDDRVAKTASAVENAAKRRHFLFDFVEKGGDFLRVGDIDGARFDASAGVGKFVDGRRSFFGGTAA